MLNIKKHALAATSAIHVKDAEGVPMYDGDKPVRIIVHGPGSRAFGLVESRQGARAVKRMNDNDGKLSIAASEERRAETAEDLASLTIAFENFDLGEGSPQGEDLFLAVYGDPELVYITKQVTKHLADTGNFKPGSAGN
jgi:hypothetical protein